MGSQKGEFGRDNRNKPQDQAERLRNSRVSNEQLAEMIALNGDKLDHLHDIGHKTMGRIEDLTREVEETKTEVAETRAEVGVAVEKLGKQSVDIAALTQTVADLRQQIIDMGGDTAKLDEAIAALDALQKENDDIQAKLKAATSGGGQSAGGEI